MLLLTVITGPDRGRTYRLSKDMPHLIGRETGSVQLRDRNVSRRHAEIIFDEGTFYTKDLGSSNGTRVDRRKISNPTPIMDGSTLQVGNTLCVCVLVPETATTDASGDQTIMLSAIQSLQETVQQQGQLISSILDRIETAPVGAATSVDDPTSSEEFADAPDFEFGEDELASDADNQVLNELAEEALTITQEDDDLSDISGSAEAHDELREAEDALEAAASELDSIEENFDAAIGADEIADSQLEEGAMEHEEEADTVDPLGAELDSVMQSLQAHGEPDRDSGIVDLDDELVFDGDAESGAGTDELPVADTDNVIQEVATDAEGGDIIGNAAEDFEAGDLVFTDDDDEEDLDAFGAFDDVDSTEEVNAKSELAEQAEGEESETAVAVAEAEPSGAKGRSKGKDEAKGKKKKAKMSADEIGKKRVEQAAKARESKNKGMGKGVVLVVVGIIIIAGGIVLAGAMGWI